MEPVVAQYACCVIEVETNPPSKLHDKVVPQSTRLKTIDSTILSSFLKNKSVFKIEDNIGVTSISKIILGSVPSVMR